MAQTKDLPLLLMVTFISIVFILPEDSILRGLDRTYMFTALVIITMIALTHYSKLVVVAAVLIVSIGANLPQDIARILNLDTRILMIALVAIVLVALANQIFKLPTGLDKAQGFPAGNGSVNPNPNIVELNSGGNHDPESRTPGNSDPVLGPDLKDTVSG
jgi:hypothetical protein